jgi:hypothetical protein
MLRAVVVSRLLWVGSQVCLMYVYLMYACMYVCIYVCIVCMYVSYVCMYVCMYVYTCIYCDPISPPILYTHIHTYIHTCYVLTKPPIPSSRYNHFVVLRPV